MRRFIVHTYPRFTCDFAHTGWGDDYKELLSRDLTQQEFNIFINTHTADYLRQLVTRTPLLSDYITQNPLGYSGKVVSARAIREHLNRLKPGHLRPAPLAS